MLGIVACQLPPGDAATAFAGLCHVVAEALGAEAVGIVSGSGDAAEVRAQWSRQIDGSARLGEIAAVLVARPGGVAEPEPGVLAIGLPGDGALVAAGVAGDAADPSVRLALGIAADRAGAAFALARARADLDGTLARVLESDERLVGRIGLDIHDGPTQHLSVGLLEVQLLQAQLGDAQAAGVSCRRGSRRRWSASTRPSAVR